MINFYINIDSLSLLSVTKGQRPRNYLSCCSCFLWIRTLDIGPMTFNIFQPIRALEASIPQHNFRPWRLYSWEQNALLCRVPRQLKNSSLKNLIKIKISDLFNQLPFHFYRTHYSDIEAFCFPKNTFVEIYSKNNNPKAVAIAIAFRIQNVRLDEIGQTA